MRPCGRSWSSSAGPSTPAWMRAAREARSISSTRSSRAEVDRHDARDTRRRPAASTPPTTLEPPPYGIAASPRVGAPVEQRRRRRPRRAGSATTSGGFAKSRAKRAHDVAERLAVGVAGAIERRRSSRARASAAGGATRGARSVDLLDARRRRDRRHVDRRSAPRAASRCAPAARRSGPRPPSPSPRTSGAALLASSWRSPPIPGRPLGKTGPPRDLHRTEASSDRVGHAGRDAPRDP